MTYKFPSHTETLGGFESTYLLPINSVFVNRYKLSTNPPVADNSILMKRAINPLSHGHMSEGITHYRSAESKPLITSILKKRSRRILMLLVTTDKMRGGRLKGVFPIISQYLFQSLMLSKFIGISIWRRVIPFSTAHFTLFLLSIKRNAHPSSYR